MKRLTQSEENPFPYSDTNKRYHTFDYYMRRRFGVKCAKIPLDGGFSCPNIDGRCGIGGCIYCLGGSGSAEGETVEEQYARGILSLTGKWRDFGRVPYLQANTGTYGAPEHLRSLYERCAALPGAVMLAIATRADCLPPEVVQVLREVSEKIPLLVELGLQTSNDTTAELIGRGHTAADFIDGYRRLRNAGGDIAVCIHLIDGLPGETPREMEDTARFVASLAPDMVKIHLLHVLRGTPLYDMYVSGEYVPMEMTDYVSAVADQIELMPPETVIARLTGDGDGRYLASPMWSRDKKTVMNAIDKELYRRGTVQGARHEK